MKRLFVIALLLTFHFALPTSLSAQAVPPAPTITWNYNCAPLGTTYYNNTGNDFTISWPTGQNVTSVEINNDDSELPWVMSKTISPGTTSTSALQGFTGSNPDNRLNKNYYYVVYLYNGLSRGPKTVLTFPQFCKPSVTWNETCLRHDIYSDSEATISWPSNQPAGKVEIYYEYSDGENPVTWSTYKNISSGTSTQAPAGFSPYSQLSRNNPYPYRVSLWDGATSSQSVNFTPPARCVPVCHPENIAMAASPNPAIPDTNIHFTVTGDFSNIAGESSDMGFISGSGGAYSCTGSGRDFTCTARSLYGNTGTYTWTRSWNACEEGNDCSVTAPCSKSLDYVIDYPPRPDTPAVYRNPENLTGIPLGQAIHNDLYYNDSELTIVRPGIHNPREWIYIGNNGVWDPITASYPDAFWIYKDVTTEISAPAPVGFGSLGAGKDYQAFVCNDSVNPQNPDPKKCSGKTSFFCIPNDAGQSCNPSYIPPSLPPATPTPVPECQASGMTPGKNVRSDSFLSAKNEAENANNRFSTSGKCVIGKPAGIPRFSLTSYEEMKSLYFDQAKLDTRADVISRISETATQSSLFPATSDLADTGKDKIYEVKGNFTVDSDMSVSKAAVLFINGNLEIESDLTDDEVGSGLVFLVSGDAHIKDTVKTVNAFIITWGQFCSAWTGGPACDPVGDNINPAKPLTVKGSIIALNPQQEPKFVRSLDWTNNWFSPAEKLIYQPKYLSLLKNIFARDLTVWSELE